ncbi:MAG: hypothetical protein ACMXX9_02475 [Candidatus Woesearchaeota archaeon]
MPRVTIINMDRDTKQLIKLIVGALLILLGVIVIFDYLLAFFRLLLGLILIGAGFFYLNYSNNRFGRGFFRF